MCGSATLAIVVSIACMIVASMIVIAARLVAAAIMTPLTGWLAGAFGIKGVFLISVIGFTVASALCGLADSLAQMVIFRLLQGVWGAALMPLSQAVLLRINSPERHGQAMAFGVPEPWSGRSPAPHSAAG